MDILCSFAPMLYLCYFLPINQEGTSRIYPFRYRYEKIMISKEKKREIFIHYLSFAAIADMCA